MDIFPTLVDLAGLPSIQSCPARIDTSDLDLCTEGRSLAALMRDAKEATKMKDTGALTQVLRHNRYVGYTLVTKQYR